MDVVVTSLHTLTHPSTHLTHPSTHLTHPSTHLTQSIRDFLDVYYQGRFKHLQLVMVVMEMLIF